MALVAQVGRKKIKARVFFTMLYTALILLGSSMVVPFMITITGSTANDFDYERFSIAPRYFWSTRDRFVKCMVPYFNRYRNWSGQMESELVQLPAAWSTWSLIGRDKAGVDEVSEHFLDVYNKNPEKVKLIAADYSEFAQSYPLSDKIVYASQSQTIRFIMDYYERAYCEQNPDKAKKISKKELRVAALDLLGKEWGLPFESFYNIDFQTEMSYPMDFQGWFPPEDSLKYDMFNEFKKASEYHLFTPGIETKWLSFLRKEGFDYKTEVSVFPVLPSSSESLQKLWSEFQGSIAPATIARPFALRAVWYDYLQSEEVGALLGLPSSETFSVESYNKLAGTSYQSLRETPFPIPSGLDGGINKIWVTFQQERYPLRLINIHPNSVVNEQFQTFLEKTIKHLRIANELLGTDYSTWGEFTITATPELGGDEYARNSLDIWKNFVKTLPVEQKAFGSAENSFQTFLLKKYGSLDVINRAYGWHLKGIEEAFPPFMSAYTVTFLNNESYMAFLPMLDNYRTVLDFLVFNGNAVGVTLILIIMTLAFTLTVNPLAAYALSRFNIRGQDKILLFLLATMAFPAMVSAIPAYLLMRDIGLLNTFWALVVPGAANGMSIFILKGFFDSLPMELFEAATIDGAGEMQIFMMVAMPLVKPILAINCLTAFVIAYNGWQWALIICQDKSMWTIAVWLYQASQWWTNSPWIVSAGFIIASVPTFIVFLSTQKIILRGIIIPTMK
jgi:ABC-type glycerol-3-phosphate transport system permease component